MLAELRHISSLLGGSIISEAIKQVANASELQLEAEQKHQQRDLELAALAMLVSRQADLELHFRLKQASCEEEQLGRKSKNELKNDGCPLCQGSGSLDLSNVIRVKFAHADVSSNDNKRSSTNRPTRQQEEPNRGATTKFGLVNKRQSKSASSECESTSGAKSAAKLHLQTTTSYLNHSDNSAEMRDEIWAKAQICLLLEWLVNRRQDPLLLQESHQARPRSPLRSEPDDAFCEPVAAPRPPRQSSKSRAGGGHPISSSIQRMKRMDTLKRHKLKRNEQLKAQVNSTGSASSSIGALCSPTQSNQSTKRTAIAEETEEEDIGEEDEEEEEEESGSRSGSGTGSGSGYDFDALVGLAGRHPSRGEVEVDVEGAWRAEPARSPVKAQAAPAGVEGKRKGSSYSYQSLRFSLTSLLAEMSQPSGKKRFSFNPFANLSFTSPFSSPLKRSATPNQRSKGGPSGFGAGGEQQARKQSPRSQSHSSGSVGTISAASPKQTHNSSAQESTCSCLKSSGSSFSIGNSMTR